MKTYILAIAALLFTLLFTNCDKDLDDVASPDQEKGGDENASADIPDGYFVVDFNPGWGDTKAAITGPDTRIRNLRYLIYDSTGVFVKEKVVLSTTGSTTWPLAAVRDTLRKGRYTAIFFGNADPNLFPVTTSTGTTYPDILLNYKGQLTDARIALPNAEFTNTSEYYWAKVTFSDMSAAPYVLLQRIIGMFNLHRNFVDAQTALNQLVNNIVTQINYKNYIQTTVQGLLPGLIKPALNLGAVGNLVYDVVGGLDAAVNLVAGALLVPVTNALYDQLLQGLVNQVGMALTGNANQSGALAGLGVLLNPWQGNEANTAIVTIRNFPKTMDFSLNVKDYYTGDNRFRFTFTTGSTYDEKDILIRGLNGLFDVRRINVIKQGLVSGLLVDQIIDNSLLLNGAFIDITDPVQATIGSNFRYKANYSFVDLGLKSYAQQNDGNHSLTLSVQLGNIANLDGILAGIPLLGPVLNATVKGLLKNITVSLPVNLPLLGADNLTLSGSWSTPVTY